MENVWFDYDSVIVKPRAMAQIFSLKVQIDHYNGHPHRCAGALQRLPSDDQLGLISAYGVKEAFPSKILTEIISYLIHVEKLWH